MKLRFSTTYHPHTEGQTERTNQVFEDMLRACAIQYGTSWDKCLSYAEFSYNNNYQASLRYNKASTNVIYYINDKMSGTAEAKYKYDKNSPKLSRAPQGRRLGDERLEVLVVLVALRELPRVGRNWAAVA